MAAQIVGTAYVRIRAITKQIQDDIEKGVSRGADKANVDDAGERVGRRFSRKVRDTVADASSDIGAALVPLRDADRHGGLVGRRFSQAFTRELGQGLNASVRHIGEVFHTRLVREIAGRRTDFEMPGLPSLGEGDGGGRDRDFIDARVIREQGRRMGEQLALGAGTSLRTGLRRIMPTLGRESGESWSERFRDSLNRTFRRGGPVDRNLRRFGNAHADSYGRGFTGWIRRFAALTPALLAPLSGIINILISYVVTLVGQLGFLVTAAAGAGAAIGAAFALAGLAVIPLISAFTAETPALERLTRSAESLGDAWDNVGRAVQRRLFPALEDLFDVIKRDLIPGFVNFGDQIGTVSANLVRLFGDMVSAERTQARLALAFSSSGTVFNNLGIATIFFGDALLSLLVAARPLAERLSASLARIAVEWSAATEAGLASGVLNDQLTIWYDRAVLLGLGLRDFFAALWNTFEIGAQVTEPFFVRFVEWAEQWRAFTESTVGQNRIREVFEGAAEIAHEVNLIIGDIIERLWGSATDGNDANLLRVLRSIREDFLPAIDDFLTRIAETSGPALTELFTSIGEVLKSLSDTGALSVTAEAITAIAIAFERLLAIPGMGEILGILLGLGAAFKILKALGIVGLVARLAAGLSYLWGVLTGGGVVGTLVASLASTLGVAVGTAAAIVIAAFLAIVAVLWVLWRNWDTITGFLVDAWDNWVWPVIDSIRGPLGDALNWLWEEVLKPFGEFLGGVFSEAWDTATDAISDFWDLAGGVIEDIGEAIEWVYNEVLVPFGEWLRTTAPRVWDRATEAARRFKEIAIDPLERAVRVVHREALEPLGDFLRGVFRSSWDGVRSIVRTVADGFERLWQDVLEPFGQFLVDTFVQAWEDIQDAMRPLGDVASDLLRILGELWRDVLRPLGDLIAGVFNDAWETLSDVWSEDIVPAAQEIRDALRDVWQAADELWRLLQESFLQVWEDLSRIWNEDISPAVQTLKADFDQLWAALGPVQGIIQQFGPLFLGVFGLIAIVMTRFSGSIGRVIDILQIGFRGAIQTTAAVISGIFGGAIRGATAILRGWINFGIKPTIQILSGLFGVAVRNASTILRTTLATAVAIARGAFGALRTAVSIAAATIRGGIQIAASIARGALSGLANFVRGAASSAWGVLRGAVGAVAAALERIVSAARRARDAITNLPRIPGTGGATIGPITFGAAGGIFDKATPMIIGEAGKEVLIPLTRPSRARQLAEQSGLYNVLLGQGLPGRFSGNTVTISNGAIQITFAGSTPTEGEARNVGRQVALGIEDVLAKRRINSGARTT